MDKHSINSTLREKLQLSLGSDAIELYLRETLSKTNSRAISLLYSLFCSDADDSLEGIEKMRALMRTNISILRIIVSSPCFIYTISEEGKFKGQSPLHWFMLSPINNSLRKVIAGNTELLSQIIKSEVFTRVATEGCFKGFSLLLAFMENTADDSYEALRIAVAGNTELLSHMIHSSAFTCVDLDLNQEPPLFSLILSADISSTDNSYEILRKAIAANTELLKHIIYSSAFTSVITKGHLKEHSLLGFFITMTMNHDDSYEALRKAVANNIELLRHIIYSHAFTYIMTKGYKKGASSLSMFIGASYDSSKVLRKAVANNIELLRHIIQSPAFTSVITEGEHKGKSPLLLLMMLDSDCYGALRKTIAANKELLRHIIHSNIFTHIATEGEFKGKSPLLLLMEVDNDSYGALRKTVADNIELLIHIIQLNAFTHVATEGHYKEDSPLSFLMSGQTSQHERMRYAIASNSLLLDRLISSFHFIHLIASNSDRDASCKAISQRILENKKYVIRVDNHLQGDYLRPHAAALGKTPFITSILRLKKENEEKEEFFLKTLPSWFTSTQVFKNISPHLSEGNPEFITFERQGVEVDGSLFRLLENELAKKISADIKQETPQDTGVKKYLLNRENFNYFKSKFRPLLIELDKKITGTLYVCNELDTQINFFLTQLTPPAFEARFNPELIHLEVDAIDTCAFTCPLLLSTEITVRGNVISSDVILKCLRLFLNTMFKLDFTISKKLPDMIFIKIPVDLKVNTLLDYNKEKTWKDIFYQCLHTACIPPTYESELEELEKNIKEMMTIDPIYGCYELPESFYKEIGCSHLDTLMLQNKKITTEIQEINSSLGMIEAFAMSESKHKLFEQAKTILRNRDFINDYSRSSSEFIEVLKKEVASINLKITTILSDVSFYFERKKQVWQAMSYSYRLNFSKDLLDELYTFKAYVNEKKEDIAFIISHPSANFTLKLNIFKVDEANMNTLVLKVKNLLGDRSYTYWKDKNTSKSITTLSASSQRPLTEASSASILSIPRSIDTEEEATHYLGILAAQNAATQTKLQELLVIFYERTVKEAEQRHAEERKQARAREEASRWINRSLTPPSSLSIFPRNYPLVIADDITLQESGTLSTLLLQHAPTYQNYFDFLLHHLETIMASLLSQPLPPLPETLLNAYGFLLALLSLLGEKEIKSSSSSDAIPTHSNGIRGLKIFSSHVCHVEIINLVNELLMGPSPLERSWRHLQDIWDLLTANWNNSSQIQYFKIKALLDLKNRLALDLHENPLSRFLKMKETTPSSMIKIIEGNDRPFASQQVAAIMNKCKALQPYLEEPSPAHFGTYLSVSVFLREINLMISILNLGHPLRVGKFIDFSTECRHLNNDVSLPHRDLESRFKELKKQFIDLS